MSDPSLYLTILLFTIVLFSAPLEKTDFAFKALFKPADAFFNRAKVVIFSVPTKPFKYI